MEFFLPSSDAEYELIRIESYFDQKCPLLGQYVRGLVDDPDGYYASQYVQIHCQEFALHLGRECIFRKLLESVENDTTTISWHKEPEEVAKATKFALETVPTLKDIDFDYEVELTVEGLEGWWLAMKLDQIHCW